MPRSPPSLGWTTAAGLPGRRGSIQRVPAGEQPAAGPKGTVYLRYGLAGGPPATGDMTAADRGVGRED
jgi:hypothetical protein